MSWNQGAWIGAAGGGGVGGIDYANPIEANSTGTVTPTNGASFTSTSKLVTIGTIGNQRLLPDSLHDSGTTDGTTASKLVDSTQDFDADGTQDDDIVMNTTDTTRAKITAIDAAGILAIDADIMVSGDTYEIHKANRVIWGLGASAAATLKIDPVSLSAGDTFSITAFGGESKILEWDGTDFNKIGGVSIPLECKMNYIAAAAHEAIADRTLTTLPLGNTLIDNSQQMADPITNNRINLVRGGLWRIVPNIGWYTTPGSAVTLDHDTQSRVAINGTSGIVGARGWLHALSTTPTGMGVLFDFHSYLAGDYVGLVAWHDTLGTAETINIWGSTGYENHFVYAVEVKPW